MKINDDCVRDVLTYLIQNLDITIEFEKIFFKNISLKQLINHFSNQYTPKDIWYAVYLLSQDTYIETNDLMKNKNTSSAYVSNVTHKGHDFCESIRPESIWQKTKSVVGKVGVHTLSFMESIAHDIAVETAKEIVKKSL